MAFTDRVIGSKYSSNSTPPPPKPSVLIIWTSYYSIYLSRTSYLLRYTISSMINLFKYYNYLDTLLLYPQTVFYLLESDFSVPLFATNRAPTTLLCVTSGWHRLLPIWILSFRDAHNQAPRHHPYPQKGQRLAPSSRDDASFRTPRTTKGRWE